MYQSEEEDSEKSPKSRLGLELWLRLAVPYGLSVGCISSVRVSVRVDVRVSISASKGLGPDVSCNSARPQGPHTGVKHVFASLRWLAIPKTRGLYDVNVRGRVGSSFETLRVYIVRVRVRVRVRIRVTVRVRVRVTGRFRARVRARVS